MQLRLGSVTLKLDRPQVMGILNVTPDSFSDGGRFSDVDGAVRHALKMIDQGAAIIDIGGESTRPGAAAVAEQVEIDRVLPVIDALARQSDVPISVDTSKPVVMAEAVAAGATMINDIYALRRDNAMRTVADLGVAVCLMHMLGEPGTMQDAPYYVDVVSEVTDFLAERVARCRSEGIASDKICVDPGFGFGKTDKHNLVLLRNLNALQQLQLPILVGLSRKGTLGKVTGRGAEDRLAAGIAAATYSVLHGASLVRTHDVAATVDALKMLHAIQDDG